MEKKRKNMEKVKRYFIIWRFPLDDEIFIISRAKGEMAFVHLLARKPTVFSLLYASH